MARKTEAQRHHDFIVSVFKVREEQMLRDIASTRVLLEELRALRLKLEDSPPRSKVKP